MLTFKTPREVADAEFDKAIDRRNDAINDLLNKYHAADRKAVDIIAALNNLSAAQDDFDETGATAIRFAQFDERLDALLEGPSHIKDMKLGDVLAAQEAAEAPDASWLTDETTPPALRGGAEFLAQSDEPAPWRTADIGCGSVEYKSVPEDNGQIKEYAKVFGPTPAQRGELLHAILEELANHGAFDDEKLPDDPHPGHSSKLSLHGDGKVKPLGDTAFRTRATFQDRINAMRAEIEAATNGMSVK